MALHTRGGHRHYVYRLALGDRGRFHRQSRRPAALLKSSARLSPGGRLRAALLLCCAGACAMRRHDVSARRHLTAATMNRSPPRVANDISLPQLSLTTPGMPTRLWRFSLFRHIPLSPFMRATASDASRLQILYLHYYMRGDDGRHVRFRQPVYAPEHDEPMPRLAAEPLLRVYFSRCRASHALDAQMMPLCFAAYGPLLKRFAYWCYTPTSKTDAYHTVAEARLRMFPRDFAL